MIENNGKDLSDSLENDGKAKLQNCCWSGNSFEPVGHPLVSFIKIMMMLMKMIMKMNMIMKIKIKMLKMIMMIMKVMMNMMMMTCIKEVSFGSL